MIDLKWRKKKGKFRAQDDGIQFVIALSDGGYRLKYRDDAGGWTDWIDTFDGDLQSAKRLASDLNIALKKDRSLELERRANVLERVEAANELKTELRLYQLWLNHPWERAYMRPRLPVGLLDAFERWEKSGVDPSKVIYGCERKS